MNTEIYRFLLFNGGNKTLLYFLALELFRNISENRYLYSNNVKFLNKSMKNGLSIFHIFKSYIIFNLLI